MSQLNCCLSVFILPSAATCSSSHSQAILSAAGTWVSRKYLSSYGTWLTNNQLSLTVLCEAKFKVVILGLLASPRLASGHTRLHFLAIPTARWQSQSQRCLDRSQAHNVQFLTLDKSSTWICLCLWPCVDGSVMDSESLYRAPVEPSGMMQYSVSTCAIW